MSLRAEFLCLFVLEIWTSGSIVDIMNIHGLPYYQQLAENKRGKMLEARVGIEPTHKGFADLSLTTWVPRPYTICRRRLLERETGVEPATSSLARKHSTTELLPPCQG
jgi:hypothetical protein